MLGKQGRSDRHLTKLSDWQRYISALYNSGKCRILAAYIDSRIVGYITAVNICGSYYILDPYYDLKAAASSPTQGLIFCLVNQILDEEGQITIYYGIESFSPLPSLNKYKQSMLFRREPATRVYFLHPFVKLGIWILVMFSVKILRKKSFKSLFMKKSIWLLQGSRIPSKEKQ